MSCDHCPCPSSCLAWPAFCGWASEEPPDPVKLRHIRHRSERGPAQADPAAPSVRESLELTRLMRACPYRSTDAGCGCSGGRCALRGASVVSHIDCFACLRRHDLTAPN
jgi:hypothetical protein